MTIRITDPLFLLSAQTGLSVTELRAEAAEGNPDVNKPQEVCRLVSQFRSCLLDTGMAAGV